MKGLVIFAAVVTVIFAHPQVTFPNHDEFESGRSNSNDVNSQLITAFSSMDNPPSLDSLSSLDRTSNDICSLPNGDLGNCTQFSECSAYSHLTGAALQNPDNLNFLRARVCRLLTNLVLVCCPIGKEPTVAPQPHVPSVSENTLFPSDCGQSFADRITQGTEIAVGAYPWLVAVGKPDTEVFEVNCGGTLITRRHVLTAAHCFAKFFKPTHVRVGEHDVTTDNDGANPKTYSISRIILSDYNADTNHNDIALLTLNADVSFNNHIQPICLPFRDDLRNNNFVGVQLDVAGWGRTNHTIRMTSPIPLEAKVEVVTSDRCQQAYNAPDIALTITDRQLCAGTGGADTCNGDSGGPLNYLDQQTDRYYLAGVTSFGVDCGRPDFPGVYTRVGSYLDWIELNAN